MRKLWRIFRFWLAYKIAPEWIDDLEYRLGAFLCYQTGCRLSKPYYPLDVMKSAADDYQQNICEECEYRQSSRKDGDSK